MTDYSTAKRGGGAKGQAFLLELHRRGIFLTPVSANFYLSLAQTGKICDQLLDRADDSLTGLPS